MECPIAQIRDLSTEYFEETKSITVDAKSKSFSPYVVAFVQQLPAFQEEAPSYTAPLRPATMKFMLSDQESIWESVNMVFAVEVRLCSANSRGVDVSAEYLAGTLR